MGERYRLSLRQVMSLWQVGWQWLRRNTYSRQRRQESASKSGRLRLVERLEDRRLLAVDLTFQAPTVGEATGSTALVASLASPTTTPTYVDVALGGVATLGRDYQVSSTRITIAAGRTTGSIALTALDDTRTEADELIEARVASVTGSKEQWTGQPAYTRVVDNDSPLLINGTPANDTLLVWLGPTSFNYQLNQGTVTTVSYSQFRSARFNDIVNGGTDTIVLQLASTGSQVTVAQNAITVEGSVPFDLWSSNIEKQYVNGSSRDSAVLKGTTGNDNYWGLPTYSVMKSGTLMNQVTGIRNVTMYGQGGLDTALLYGNGTTSVDAFVGNSTVATMSKQSGTPGDRTLTFSNTVRDFRYVHAYADDIRDTARLNDVEDKDDTLWANPAMAYMLASRSSTYQNTVYGYKSVTAVSTGGNDSAVLNDSAGVDTLTANNVQSRLTYADKGFVEARGFRDVSASSKWNATVDAVFFTDSWIADIDTTSSNALERARDDYLNVVNDTAQMIYGNRSVLAQGFEKLDARATLGGTDTHTIQTAKFANPNITGFVNEATLDSTQVAQLLATRAYLRNANLFDVRRYMTRGSDYLNPEFSDFALRLQDEWADAYGSRGPLTADNIAQVSTLPIYDFSRLERVEKSLVNVLRQSVLQRLFDEITRNATNNVERQTAIIEFDHKSVRHTEYIQPLTYDLKVRAETGKFIYSGGGVADPLVLLELAEGRCGQVNKVNADLWHALGFRGRLVGVNAHTSGEVYYEGQWHYNDSGAFGGDDVPLIPVKPGSSVMKIPSFEELRQRPDLIDLLPFYTGVMGFTGNKFPNGSSPTFASPAYFDNLGDGYVYIEKNAIGDERAQNSRFYGWESYLYNITPIPWVTRTPSATIGTQPSPAYINSVAVAANGSLGGDVTIGWRSSYDNPQYRVNSKGNPVLNANGTRIVDWASPTGAMQLYSDVVGYQVFVSTTSRGWNYNEYKGTDSVAASVKAYKASNALWTPEMYDARYSSAPRDVMTVFVTAKSKTLGGNELAQLRLPTSGTYYISIMPVDARGLAIGKTNYMLSEEIKITI